MIGDHAPIALGDGTSKLAIDLFPGGEILSIRQDKAYQVAVMGREVKNEPDAICLVLSNGQKLLASREQKVCVNQNSRAWFKEMADIEVGMTLRGREAGMPTLVRVIGVMLFPRHAVRLVGFKLPGNATFVAGGVLCRS